MQQDYNYMKYLISKIFSSIKFIYKNTSSNIDIKKIFDTQKVYILILWKELYVNSSINNNNNINKINIASSLFNKMDVNGTSLFNKNKK